ncbi:MAG: cytochrome C oxidase subunit IV family protein [Abditibacteriaceae bacterium]
MQTSQDSGLEVIHSHHIIPVDVYLKVFGALMVLLIATVLAAMEDFSIRLHWGPANVVIALAIAVAKALLVILFFMHVKYSSRLTQFFAGIAFLFLGIMFFFVFVDYFSRNWIPIPSAFNITGP